MDNKLLFWNMGNIESNKRALFYALEHELGVYKEDVEQIISGYKFNLYECSIMVRFFDNGTQLITEISGEYVEEVIKVYRAYSNRFTN